MSMAILDAQALDYLDVVPAIILDTLTAKPPYLSEILRFRRFVRKKLAGSGRVGAKNKRVLTPVLTPARTRYYTFVHLDIEQR
jgi:hypothetical protein